MHIEHFVLNLEADWESQSYYMKLYVFIAYLLRRFELVSAGTTERDIVWDDIIISQFYEDFKIMTKRRTE